MILTLNISPALNYLIRYEYTIKLAEILFEMMKYDRRVCFVEIWSYCSKVIGLIVKVFIIGVDIVFLLN